jgi:hypothetical protein
LNDPIKGISALSKVGVSFNDSQKAQIKSLVSQNDLMGAQKIILQELQTEFGGASRAMAQTDIGRLDQAKNILGDMKEILGRDVIPLQTTFVNLQISAVNWINDMITGYKVLAGIRLGDPLKDLTLVDEKIITLKQRISDREAGKGFLGFGAKVLGTTKAEVANMRAELADLEKEKIELQAQADKVLNPEKIKVKPIAPDAPASDTSKRKYSGVENTHLDLGDERRKRYQAQTELLKEAQKTALQNAEVYQKQLAEVEQRFAETRIAMQQDPTLTGQVGFENRAQLELDMLRQRHAAELVEYKNNSVAKNLLVQAQQNEETALVRQQAAERQRIKGAEFQNNLGMLDTVVGAVQGAAQAEFDAEKDKREQMKPILRSLAIMRFAAATASGIASAWETGKTWYEGLALSIATVIQNGVLLGTQISSINSAATGADFIATRPQLLMVGDNPARKERVSVTPIGSPNLYGPGGSRNPAPAGSGGTVINRLIINDQMTGSRLQRALRSGEMRGFVSDLKRSLVTA